MASNSGNHKLLEQLLADGMNHMYGNPGTVEQGFLDALSDHPDMRYVLALQESAAVMMADAHARATRRVQLVQIHSAPGLGNAIGALYQAMRGHAPLLVIGGDAGLCYQNLEAQMYAELVDMARPVTKWSTMVRDRGSLLRVIRRAVQLAQTPPMGPVYVCLPADILDQINDEPVFPSCRVELPPLPESGVLDDMARALIQAERPTIFVGDGVAYAQAQSELAELAELLGAEVWGVDSGELNMDHRHPCWMGQTGHMFGETSLPITRRGDAVLVVGTYMLPEVFPALGEVYDPRAVVMHIDMDVANIAKNHRVDIGALADPKASLAALCQRIAAAAQPRRDAMSARLQRLNKPAYDPSGASPVAAAFLGELARRMPDAVVFDEALTNSPLLTHHFPPSAPGRFFQTRGGSLGVGITGAIGLQLALPSERVIGFAGDGGSMYVIQALWTAAREGVPAKFVIFSNRSYQLLVNNIRQYWQTQRIEPHDHPNSFSLDHPAIDFVQLARAQGVDGMRVETAEQAAEAAERLARSEGAFLVDLII